jgi:hypothetical protein
VRGTVEWPDSKGEYSGGPDLEEIDGDFSGRFSGLSGRIRDTDGSVETPTSAKGDNTSQIAVAVGLEFGSFTQQDCASSQIASGTGTPSSSSGLSGLTS